MHRVLLAAGALIASAGMACAEDSAAAFFQGKQVQFYTMGSPGGGYDTYTRSLASRLEKALGARVVTINEPAAGGLVAMNRLLSAKPDGLSLLLIGGEALALATLMGEPGVNYDLSKQVWLARVSAEDKVVMVGPKTPFKTIEEVIASERPVTWAGSGKTDGNTDFQSLLAYATGMKAKMVIGYKGTGGMNLAMENGEIDGRVVSDESAALYGASSSFRTLTVLARQRSEKFPDVRTIFEAVKMKPEAAELLDWRAGIASLGRLVNVTPGTPNDRVTYLREQIGKILRDPEFIADLKRSQMTVGYASAEEVTQLVARAMTALDPDRLAAAKEIIINRYF
jgi:tripartite-type tricarboxylate transporter receptor subunit TctC